MSDGGLEDSGDKVQSALNQVINHCCWRLFVGVDKGCRPVKGRLLRPPHAGRHCSYKKDVTFAPIQSLVSLHEWVGQRRRNKLRMKGYPAPPVKPRFTAPFHHTKDASSADECLGIGSR